MKATKRCVKCGSRRIFFSPCIMDRGSGNVPQALSIGRPDPISGREIGQFEVFACKRCGYSELYVRDPKDLPALTEGQAADEEE